MAGDIKVCLNQAMMASTQDYTNHHLMVQKELKHLIFIDANLKVVKEFLLIVVIMKPHCFNHLELSSKFFSVSSICVQSIQVLSFTMMKLIIKSKWENDNFTI